MADPAAASARAVDEVTDVQLANLPPQPSPSPDTSRELLVRVDQLAQAELAFQGRSPSAWERLPDHARDELRVAALRRLRSGE